MSKWDDRDDDGLRKAEEVQKLVQKLSVMQDDGAVQEADEFLKRIDGSSNDLYNHTSINKSSDSSVQPNPPNPASVDSQYETQSAEAFMSVIEADAKKRAQKKAANRKRAEEWKERGNEYFRASDYIEAKRCYSEAMNLCKDWDILYTNLAMTCNKLGEYNETLDHCKWAERLNEQNTKSMLHRGKALVGLGRPNEALDIYKNVLEIDPKKKSFMREYIAEAEAASNAKIEEEKAAIVFEEKTASQSRNEDPERLVLRLICEVARPGMEPIYYSGGIRCLAQAMKASLSMSQTLFRSKGGFTLLERSDNIIGETLSKSLSQQDKSYRDILLSIFELGVVVCDDCEENQRRMLAVPKLSARLEEVLKLSSSKSIRDPLLIAALHLLFVISQSDAGRKAVNDWLTPVVILPKLVECVQYGTFEGVGQNAAALLNNMALSPRFQKDILSSGNMQITEAVECLLQDGGGQSAKCLPSCLNCLMNLCANTTIRRRLSGRTSFLKATTSALKRYLPLHSDERHSSIIQALLGLLINVTTGVDKTSGAICSVAPSVVSSCSKVLATDHLNIHRERLFTLLSMFLPICGSELVEAWSKNDSEGRPIIGMARRIICHETGDHPATSVAIRVMAAATQHHTDTRYQCGDDEELVTRLAAYVQSSRDETLAGNAALCLSHCIEDTCLAEHLTNTDIILGLLRRCSNSERSEARANYGLLVAKLAQANPKHRERVSELKGFEVIHSATRLLRT